MEKVYILERQAMWQRLAAAVCAFGALLHPEILDIPEDVTGAGLGAIAVYAGLKSIHTGQRDSSARQAIISAELNKG